MAQELIVSNANLSAEQINTAALMLGAGLALTSMILIPALAMRLGLSASLTGALRSCLDEGLQSRSRLIEPRKIKAFVCCVKNQRVFLTLDKTDRPIVKLNHSKSVFAQSSSVNV